MLHLPSKFKLLFVLLALAVQASCAQNKYDAQLAETAVVEIVKQQVDCAISLALANPVRFSFNDRRIS